MMASMLSFLILGLQFIADNVSRGNESEGFFDDEDFVSGFNSHISSTDAIRIPPKDCKKGFTPRSVRITITGEVEYICKEIRPQCQENILRENNNIKMCLNEKESDSFNHNSSWCLAVKATFTLGCDKNDSTTTTSLKDTADSFENLVINNSLPNIKEKEDLVLAVNFALKLLGSFAGTRALQFPEKQPETVITSSVAIQTNIITKDFISQNETLKLEAQGNQMAIFPSAVINMTTQEPVGVAFLSLIELGSQQGESILQEQTNSGTLGNMYMNSRVLSASTSNLIRNISSLVNITFRHLKDIIPQENATCVHWDHAELAWSSEGSWHLYSNTTHSRCSYQYLSNFALLLAATPMQVLQGEQILYLITYIGLTISLICLFLSILTFILCRSIQNHSTFIHLQLSICLFFGDLLFIIGIDKADNKILCSIIAGMLQYLFLACFVWMFLEGLNLYLIVKSLKVAHYRGTSKNVKISMYLCGYGIPAMIIAISAAIVPDGYGSHNYCWLTHEKGFIWSFMGPVCAVIVINLIFFCLILKNLHKNITSLNSEVTNLRNSRSLLFKAVAHVFILGVTWCLGFFQVGPLAVVMAYLFTITNSLQGIFIFLVHCLLNQKVRQTYWHWICCFREVKLPITEMTLSSVPISSPKESEQSTASVNQQKIDWTK